MIQTCKQYDSIESQLKVFFYKDIHLFTYMYATLSAGLSNIVFSLKS